MPSGCLEHCRDWNEEDWMEEKQKYDLVVIGGGPGRLYGCSERPQNMDTIPHWLKRIPWAAPA